MTDLQAYDFGRPGRLSVDQEQLLQVWLRHFCEILPESLHEFLGIKLPLEFTGFDVQLASHAMADFPDPGLGFRCACNAMEHNSLLVFSRMSALSTIAQLFENGETGDPADRELTRVELSVCEPVFNTLARVLGQAWTSPGSITFDLDSVDERPSRTRMFESDDRLLRASFNIEGREPLEMCSWLFPFEEIAAVLQRALQPRSESSEALRRQIERRVNDVRLPFVVRLGEARVPFSKLARLSHGDVIVLNQKIHDPVSASVAGREQFLGLPGCSGRTQVFQVTELAEGAAE